MAKYKDNLRRPFEKPETKNQRKLHTQIKQLFEQKFVVKMSYPEIFDVLDRVKLSYQLDMCKRLGMINYNQKEDKTNGKEKN